MSRVVWGRVMAVMGVGLLAGFVVVSLPSAASAKTHGLRVSPHSHLGNDEEVVVRGPNLPAGDEVELIQCLRGATSLTSCDPATATPPVQVSAVGTLPPTDFTVMTGTIGTGTCGTSRADYNACEIAAQDITGTTLFAAYRGIAFYRDVTTTTTTLTLPSPPSTP